MRSTFQRCALMLAAVAIVGCGGRDLRNGAEPTSEAGSAITATTASETAKGVVVDAADIEAERRPEAAMVLEFLRTLQIGAFPALPEYYHSRVLDTFREADVIEAMAAAWTSFQLARPRITEVVERERGTLVTVAAMPEDAAPLIWSFIVGEEEDEPVILYDTVLGEHLSAAVEGRIQREESPGSDPSARAVEQGARAAARFRSLFSR